MRKKRTREGEGGRREKEEKEEAAEEAARHPAAAPSSTVEELHGFRVQGPFLVVGIRGRAREGWPKGWAGQQRRARLQLLRNYWAR